VPITAEGVESERIRDALKGICCSEAQGWLFGRAISGEAVRAFLDTKDESDMPARFAANQRGFRGPK
jgi:EAL domain-containing protein (putative c-di-GMP-specific phosphodiesterase class I)